MPAEPLPMSLQDRRLAFGAVIRARRTTLGLSQLQLARRAGCNRQSIVRVETAAHPPSLDRIFTLADALGAHVSELFQEADRMAEARAGRRPAVARTD